MSTCGHKDWDNDLLFVDPPLHQLNRAAFLLWPQLKPGETRNALAELLKSMKRSREGAGEDLGAVSRFLDAFVASLAADEQIRRCHWYDNAKIDPELDDRVRFYLFKDLSEEDLSARDLDLQDGVTYSTSPLETILMEFGDPESLPVPEVDFDMPAPATLSIGTDLLLQIKDLLREWDEVRGLVDGAPVLVEVVGYR